MDGRALSGCGLSPVGFAGGWDRAYAHVSLAYARAGAPLAVKLMTGPGRIGFIRRALTRQYLEHGDRQPASLFAGSFGDLAESPGYWPTLRHAINWQAPYRRDLDRPITVAWGEKDRLLLTGPQTERARVRLPTASHVVLRDCGHLPAWDDPDQVATVIKNSII